jgi:hypothetical protein
LGNDGGVFWCYGEYVGLCVGREGGEPGGWGGNEL